MQLLRVIALGSLALMAGSRPGRDSQPFGVGLLIGAVISAALWAAIGVAIYSMHPKRGDQDRLAVSSHSGDVKAQRYKPFGVASVFDDGK